MHLISEINKQISRSGILTKTKRLGRSLVMLRSDALSTLSQESSGPFSPLGERVGARIEGLCLGFGNRVRENSFSRFFLTWNFRPLFLSLAVSFLSLFVGVFFLLDC